MSKTKLMLGDNIESLKKLPDNSVDSIVTDPPYALTSIKKRFGKEGSAPAQYGTDGAFQRASKGFMGKEWDAEVPTVEFWREVYRVLKPGGHVLSFGGTRTYHRMTVNIEDAGFEIRDQIQWIYASGFPKSLNIQKQFDKNGYKVCECSEQNTEHDLRQVSEANIPQTINSENEQGKALLSQLPQQDIQVSEHATNNVWREQSIVEGWSNTIQEEGQLQRNNLQESTREFETDGEKGWLYNGTQNDNGSNGEQIIDENRSGSSQRPQPKQQSSKQSGTMADKRRPQESGSRKICGRCGEQVVNVKGFGTALKPANEPICVARKPLSEKSVAENVLRWGTGGINIDGCRVKFDDKDTNPATNPLYRHKNADKYKQVTDHGQKEGVNVAFTNSLNPPSEEGRFPANIILDEIAGELLDEQTGYLKSGEVKPHHKKNKTANGYQGSCYGKFQNEDTTLKGYGDGGGASRFFYQAKVSKAERNMGLDGFEETTTGGKGHGLDRRCSHCNTSMLKPEDCKCEEPDWITPAKKNSHPTVKPVSLMAYLCRLVTPPNGIVLDPFMGSGSTGIAARLEGFKFLGMEMDKDYFKIAESRIENFEEYRKFIK